MAEILHAYKEVVGAETSSPHDAWQTKITITGTELADLFSSGGDNEQNCLVIVTGYIKHASSASQCKTHLLLGGVEVLGSYGEWETTANVQATNFGFATEVFIDTLDTIPDLEFQIASSATATVTIDWAGILFIPFDAIGGYNTDDAKSLFLWEGFSTPLTTTTTYTNWGAFTMNAAAGENYLILASCQITPGSSSASHMVRLQNTTTDTTISEIIVEGEDPTFEKRQYLLMGVASIANNDQIAVQYAHESGTGSTVRYSFLSIIKLDTDNLFKQVSYQTSAAAAVPSTGGFGDMVTSGFSAADSGPWLIWSYAEEVVNSTTDSLSIRQRVPVGGVEGNYPPIENVPLVNNWDATDVVPLNLFTVQTLTPGAKFISLQAELTTGTTQQLRNNKILAVRLAVPSGIAPSFVLADAALLELLGLAGSLIPGEVSLTANAATGEFIPRRARASVKYLLDAFQLGTFIRLTWE